MILALARPSIVRQNAYTACAICAFCDGKWDCYNGFFWEICRREENRIFCPRSRNSRNYDRKPISSSYSDAQAENISEKEQNFLNQVDPRVESLGERGGISFSSTLACLHGPRKWSSEHRGNIFRKHPKLGKKSQSLTKVKGIQTHHAIDPNWFGDHIFSPHYFSAGNLAGYLVLLCVSTTQNYANWC